ncbi:MAG: hypothetical protein L0Y44_10545 [Phycisphaerales bacterium]|nr:hypothetical protein [Phycisphaerales bacterium]
MASISKSAPRPRKAERKKNPRAQATRKPQAESRKPHIAAVPLGALLDVQDELHQLNAILDGLPGLRQLHAVMAEILKPSKAPEHDRISPWALALTHKPPRAEGNQPCMDEADLIDLGAAADVILSAVRCRIQRIAALMGLLVKRV